MPDDQRVTRVDTDRGEDLVVREGPLVIEIGHERVLTMRTPGDDVELAAGFLVSEGILARVGDAVAWEAVPKGAAGGADMVRVRLGAEVSLTPMGRDRLARAHGVRASCGLCGLTSAEGLTRHLRPLAPGRPRLTLPALGALRADLEAAQEVFRQTGGCHAAGVFGPGGEVWAVREDVGRHNALDKALGRCLLDQRDLSQAVILLSGRAGYELVLKALRVGVPVVASVSAPSSLAVELAEEHGQTLVAFLRGESARVYADDGRLGS